MSCVFEVSPSLPKADTMGVSLRTVEAHMYKALKLLRDKLGYLNLMLALFFIGKVSVFASSVVLLS